MTCFSSFQDVIDAWPSRRAFADDIGASLAAVNKMHEKDSVRGIYFAAIVEASRRRHAQEAQVTADDLCRLAARQHVAAERVVERRRDAA